MLHGVPGGTVCGHAVGDTVGNGELEPIHGLHVVTQENAVAIVDQCEDSSDAQRNPCRRGYSVSFASYCKECFHCYQHNN